MEMNIHLFILVALSDICLKCAEADCNNVFPVTPTFMDCRYRCHCKNDEQCDQQTGSCSSGCEFGWMGPGCQYRNVAKHQKTVKVIGNAGIQAEYAVSAVDGDIQTCCKSEPSHTAGLQWWRIEWDREFLVKGLVLKLPSDNLDAFRNFLVETGTGPTNSDYGTLCYQHADSPGSVEMEIMCQQSVRTRHLRVILAIPDVPIRLCEVEVYGGRQTSFNMETDQSSTYQQFHSFRSVDGHDLSQYSGSNLESATSRTCSATNGGEMNPWWYVNLGEVFDIEDIYFFGRQDKEEQFRNYTLSVGNSSDITKDVYQDDGVGTAASTYQPKETQFQNIERGQFLKVERRLNRYALITICEVLAFADCPANECGWHCSLPCYCQGEVTGNMKIEGLCPYGCLYGWTGNDGKCDTGCWGDECEHECGNCLEQPCNIGNGECSSGCNGPWYPPLCTLGCWGDECEHECGNCLEQPCNIGNGECSSGCNGPWYPPLCTLGCDNYTYGINCSNHCGNCRNGVRCDIITGICPDGCDDGWYLDNCTFVCEIGTYGYNCSEKCGNCNLSLTCNHVNGHCENGCEAGYRGNLCKKECENGTYGLNCSGKCGVCFGEVTCNHVTGHCPDGCAAGFIGNLCTDVCTNGTYGTNCTSECGFCLNNSSCNNVNGWCENGCQDGWKGNLCVDVCQNGTYGFNCSNDCGNCLGSVVCNHVTGYCEQGCESGYTGHFCIEGCEIGTYGLNCSGQCGNCLRQGTCDRVTGHCNEGCRPGYHGIMCTDECSSGSYGLNCSNECGNCLNNATCDHVNGICENGCQEGWKGEICVEGCDTGTYGLGCSQICGNCKTSTCTHTTGTCPLGCLDGFEGDLCISEVLEPPVGTIVGSVAGVIIALAVGVAALLIFKRRRRRQSKKKDSSENNTCSDPQVLWARECSQKETPQQVTLSNTTAETKGSKRHLEPIYCNNQKEDSAIPISQLRSICITSKRDPTTCYSEFKTLPYGLQHDASEAKDIRHRSKNRYKDMYPYNANRVLLPEIPGTEGSTYINASRIDGYQSPGKYIAAQGALGTTVHDIWRMVWSEGITVIVMLTRCYELGRMKCFQYWSDEGQFEHGDIRINITSVEKYSDFEIRTFVCSKTDSLERRTVLQYHYTAWPDKDVPDTALSLAQFWHTVRKNDIAKNTPWLIHCSAGVGRTGTFIALDYLYDQGMSEGKVDVKGVVYSLREQRLNMVQMKEQYLYLHEVTAEALDPIGSVCETDQFSAIYQKQMNNRETVEETLFDEYKKLCETTETDNESEAEIVYSNITDRDMKDAQRTENVHKSRNLDIIPADNHRPRLSMTVDGRNDFINAVFVPTFRQRDRMILTQLPAEDTVVDFIRMMWEFDVKTVVLLENDASEDVKYWTTQKNIKSVGPFKMELINEAREDVYVLRTIRYAYEGKTEEKVVKQFHFTAWPKDSATPINTESILHMITDIENVIEDASSPLVVQCHDGAKKSGLLCVLCCVLERMKTDREVAIAETVRLVRLRRKQAIDNFDQYLFCYNTIQHYLESHSVYANVL
ncbi:uncharacterized protein LOC123556423 isoform X2 [Mercenaria mercenaria]|uniref:uncharacterized protein LOC123556423 isoform X2 n=1 Tax=Mercenaria mercenaria TaxID=6596 RepID=UPI00234F6338|nr:uncharacterized protein LOC123556423 isoform X2 [Mercenaria mercenaria]